MRRYADVAAVIHEALEHYREDVERRAYPSGAESYHLPQSALGAVREAALLPVADQS